MKRYQTGLMTVAMIITVLVMGAMGTAAVLETNTVQSSSANTTIQKN